MAPAPFPARKPGKVLRPMFPNEGIEAAYARRLIALTEEMNRSLLYWVRAAYRAHEPVMTAMDATPAQELRRILRHLGARWLKRFDEAAPKLADHFAKEMQDRSDRALARILRDGGISVKFQTTKAIRDVMAASVGENVGLIKSIAQKHHQQVEGAVMRSAAIGGDLQSLTKELSHGFGVTRRRAAFIAKDQTRKMNAVITKARYTELGIEKAVWLHSGGGHHPRPEHVAFSGKTYEVAKGAFLEGEWVWPGTAINCRCVSKPIVPGYPTKF